MTDRRKRIADYLNAPERRHWRLLLYWPFYVIAYSAIGHLGGRIPPVCTSFDIDRALPYVPAFIIPYLSWFPYWVGTLAYAMFREPKLFRRMMHYFMLTFTIAVCIFWAFPTTTGLRPALEGRSLFIQLTRFVYWIDADANVCPSEHIVGVFAVLFAVWDSERLARPAVKWAAVIIGLFIAASTVLVRQHALIDLAAALALSALGGYVCFFRPRRQAARNA